MSAHGISVRAAGSDPFPAGTLLPLQRRLWVQDLAMIVKAQLSWHVRGIQSVRSSTAELSTPKDSKILRILRTLRASFFNFLHMHRHAYSCKGRFRVIGGYRGTGNLGQPRV